MFNDTDVRFNGTETRLPLTVKERKVTDGQREREKQRRMWITDRGQSESETHPL